MSRKVYFLAGPIAIVIIAFAAAHHALAQKSAAPAPPIPSGSLLPTLMFIHGHIDYKDMEHCFVQDSGDKKRALYLDAYTDVSNIDPQKVYLRLYNLKNGEVKMTRGHDWDASVTGSTIYIVIKADAPPHLGPGPYSAAITVDMGARNPLSFRTWSYPYGTWVDGTSPVPDCLF
jgi:hypothetical protein